VSGIDSSDPQDNPAAGSVSMTSDDRIKAARATADGDKLSLAQATSALVEGDVYKTEFWDAIDFAFEILNTWKAVPVKFVVGSELPGYAHFDEHDLAVIDSYKEGDDQ
jgi:hypothetical protein